MYLLYTMEFVCVTKGHCHHYSTECHLPFGWLLEKPTDIPREWFFKHWLQHFSRITPHTHSHIQS